VSVAVDVALVDEEDEEEVVAAVDVVGIASKGFVCGCCA
jgi:hypothetical protein